MLRWRGARFGAKPVSACAIKSEIAALAGGRLPCAVSGAATWDFIWGGMRATPRGVGWPRQPEFGEHMDPEVSFAVKFGAQIAASK